MQYGIHQEGIYKYKTIPFLIDVFQSWIEYNEKLVVDDEFILKSPIFYNKNILIGKQTIDYDKWFKNVVRFINDLVKDDGEFFSYQEFLDRARVQTNCLQYVRTIQVIKANIKNKKKILSTNLRAILYLLTFPT